MPRLIPGDARFNESEERDYLQGLPSDAQLPSYFSRDENGTVGRAGNVFQRHSWLGPLAFAGGAIAAPYVAGALGGGGGGSTAALGPSTSGNIAATSAASSAAPAGISAGGGASMGGASGILKGLIPDSKTLILSLLSLFGGGGAQPTSFRDPGHMTDPKQAMQETLNGIYRLGQGVTEMAPAKLRSSYVQAGPAPVTIPGLPFQIGGGLGRDPALDNPALLEASGSNPFKYDPFQSLSQAGANGNPTKAKLRTP